MIKFDTQIKKYYFITVWIIVSTYYGMPYYSNSSATKVKENKEIAPPLKDFGLRISKLLVRTL